MKGKGVPNGYTIVEVLIFLAVSGMLIVMAMIFVQGKQQAAQFQQAMNTINNQIQDVINNVSTGFYPSITNFTCSTSNPTKLAFSTGGLSSTAQGTHDNCTFLGKVIQFGAGSNGRDFNVFTVAGRRLDTLGKEVTSLQAATPTPLAPSYSSVDYTDKQTLGWGLQVTVMQINDGRTPGYTNTGAIGFIGSFGQYSNMANDQLISGAQTVNLFNVPGTTLGMSQLNVAQQINTMKDTDVITSGDLTSTTPGVAIICFNSGSGHKAAIQIGGNGRLLKTSLFMEKDATTCP